MMGPLHFSHLKHMSKSARHFKDAVASPRDVTRAMRVGTAVHRLLLGGPTPYVYDGKRQGGDWTTFAANAGCPADEIMTMVEFRAADDLFQATREHRTVRRYLDGSQYEVPLKWSAGGIACETHGIDILSADRFGDLKTVPTCEPRKLVRHCEAMLYHAQLAWYDMALDASGYARRARPPFLLCIEQKRPYDVVAIELPPETLEVGRTMCIAWLSDVRVAMDSDVWPGYSDAPIPFELYGSTMFDVDDGEVSDND